MGLDDSSRSSSVHSETGGTSVNTQRYGTATVVVASAGATGRAAEPASLLPSKGRGSRLSSAGGPLRTPPPLVLWCRRRARCVPSWLWPILGAIAILVAGVVFGVGVPVASRDPQPWGTISPIIGWTYFFAWSISFYPQVYLNWKRQSVVGLSFDFEAYNIIGFVALSVFDCAFYFSNTVQAQYQADHDGKHNTVRINDVVFGLHAVVLTLFTIFQIFIYERGTQRVSLLAKILCGLMVVGSLVYLVLVSVGVHGKVFRVMDFLYYLSFIKLFVSFIKYMPQVYLNWARKSTIGWNIWNVLLDFTGGLLSVGQLVMDSWSTNDWSGFTGNPVKFGLGSISMVFDVIFMVQHYVLYKSSNSEEAEFTEAEYHSLPVQDEFGIQGSPPPREVLT